MNKGINFFFITNYLFKKNDIYAKIVKNSLNFGVAYHFIFLFDIFFSSRSGIHRGLSGTAQEVLSICVRILPDDKEALQFGVAGVLSDGFNRDRLPDMDIQRFFFSYLEF